MNSIQRFGNSRRWSDVVIHAQTAYWVEVAEDLGGDARTQIAQVLAQIDATLAQLNGTRANLLQVMIYVADLADVSTLNELWDAWVLPGQPPVRACVQAGLAGTCKVEMVLTAATE